MGTHDDRTVSEYARNLSIYETCAQRVEALLIELLKANRIKAHFTESRAKPPESLRDKIDRAGKSYDKPLEQVSDLVGVRIVLYYQDAVASVGEIIRSELELLEQVIEHQQDQLQPDTFGYLSSHYIVGIGSARSALPEWSFARGIKIEIQVRTVLQHAWAAISHVLQYKREGDVPSQLRRKLFRLAGLFELADEQFVEIRDSRLEAVTQTKEALRDNVPGLPVDSTALIEMLDASKPFKAIIKTLREQGVQCTTVDTDGYIGRSVEELERLDTATVDKVGKLLSLDYTPFLRMLTGSLKGYPISAAYTFYLLLIASKQDAFDEERLQSAGFGPKYASLVLKSARAHPPS